MFGRKTTAQEANKDRELLLQAMDKMIAGDFSMVSSEGFSDPIYADKLNQIVGAYKKANNNYIMRLNEAMESIGDNSYVKNMLDQVSLQQKSISNMNDSSKVLKDSINNISQAMSDIRDNTHDMLHASQSSSTNMNDSIRVVNESSEKIADINTQVQAFHEKINKIGEIVDIVKKVASQSNLLALNASIEAARAGEAGKGFAVVADQIGKLASDSAKSAVNTRELIDKTLVEIQKGNEITRTTADAFNQIIADMDSFAEMAQNTMEKANTQAESLEQIGQGIEQLSGVVQGTAASSEENTAISINLAEGADKMNERVNRFKLFKD